MKEIKNMLTNNQINKSDISFRGTYKIEGPKEEVKKAYELIRQEVNNREGKPNKSFLHGSIFVKNNDPQILLHCTENDCSKLSEYFIAKQKCFKNASNWTLDNLTDSFLEQISKESKFFHQNIETYLGKPLAEIHSLKASDVLEAIKKNAFDFIKGVIKH